MALFDELIVHVTGDGKLTALLERHGATLARSLTKKVTHVVYGDGAPPRAPSPSAAIAVTATYFEACVKAGAVLDRTRCSRRTAS